MEPSQIMMENIITRLKTKTKKTCGIRVSSSVEMRGGTKKSCSFIKSLLGQIAGDNIIIIKTFE